MKINARLKTIGDLVEKDSICLDVGCDHALLDIYLVHRKSNIKTIASDIAQGPLEQAKKNIEREHLEDVIETRLGSGLETYTDEINTIIISGMGGRLTNKILSDSINVIKACSQLVLQPQSEIYLVRQYLREIGFRIDYEDMLIEDGKHYVIISARNEYIDNNKA